MRGTRGCRGALTLIDPKNRRVLAITFWDSEEDVRAAIPKMDELNREIPDVGQTIVSSTRSACELSPSGRVPCPPTAARLRVVGVIRRSVSWVLSDDLQQRIHGQAEVHVLADAI
jgi:hypothetical protein